MKQYGIYSETLSGWYTGENARGLFEPIFNIEPNLAARYSSEAAAHSTLAVIDSYEEVSKYASVLELPNMEDTALLDHLETMRVPQIEGQCSESHEGEHVGNSWTIEGPFSTVREALREYASEASRVQA